MKKIEKKKNEIVLFRGENYSKKYLNLKNIPVD